MRQYLNLLQDILHTGIRQSNRTGIDTFTLPGAMLKFDLAQGFPAVTTKKLAFNQVKGELIAFLEGATSLARFKELGCNVWDANAAAPAWQTNQNCEGPDDLGLIYGAQWRNYNQEGYDQIATALHTIRTNPESRRIIVNAWNPLQLNCMALPPCHLLFQLLPHVGTKTLHMTMYQRSCDMFLGVPFNIASYALLLELFCAWTGYKAGTLTMFLADAHIYENHMDQVAIQLAREPMKLPRLWLEYKSPPNLIEKLPLDVLLKSLHPDMIHLMDYQHHAAISAPMAV